MGTTEFKCKCGYLFRDPVVGQAEAEVIYNTESGKFEKYTEWEITQVTCPQCQAVCEL